MKCFVLACISAPLLTPLPVLFSLVRSPLPLSPLHNTSYNMRDFEASETLFEAMWRDDPYRISEMDV